MSGPGVRAVLFDMDGTLYQDFDFHRDYLRYLLEGTPHQHLTKQLIALTDDILSREKLPMDRFYRTGLAPDASSAEALAGWMATRLVDEMPFERCYRQGLGELQFLGDPWEVPTFLAGALGVLEEKGEYAFQRVRREMLGKTILPNKPLLDLLQRLRERYVTVLLSNSPQQSAADFIDHLGFTGAFTFNLYDAQKPYRLFENLRRCPALEGIPTEQLLSVGDHAFNEIVNVHLAGGKTLWMDPYSAAPQVPCTARVRDLPALMAWLEENLLDG